MASKKHHSHAAPQSASNLMPIAIIMGILLIANLGMSIKISGQLSAIAEKGIDTGEADKPAAAPQPQQPQGQQPQQLPVADVDADDDPMKGKANAPIEIIEFSDFQCPFCSRFYTQTLPQIQKEYIDTGKAKLVYRDFPLSFHPEAQKASEASECAEDQGKFWEMHDKLYENQGSLSSDSYKAWAAEMGMDSSEFDDCLDSGKYAQEVQDDMNDGRAAGVSGTPSFFINGKKLVGAHPFETFKQVLDAELQ